MADRNAGRVGGGPGGHQQLLLPLSSSPRRWRTTRLFDRSPHRARLLDRLDSVRAYFPELDGEEIQVGLVLSQKILGRGSLDPEAPGIWLRPRLASLFTIAHEMTHLLQAKGQVPRGERACDLFALARSALLVDSLPTYLRLPAVLRDADPPTPQVAGLLHTAARGAVAERERGRRDYLRRFERQIESELAVTPPLTAGTMEISTPSETGVESPPV
jgi:hypothetical protein